MTGDKSRITIGKVKKPRGNSGEVTVIPLTFEPKRFEELSAVYLENKDGKISKLRIKAVRFHKNIVIVKFRDIDTPADAWEYEGAVITIDESEAIALPEDHFFEHDIYLCDVYDEKGNSLGKIRSILKTGSNDVFVINSGKDEILLPATEDFIERIDIKEKKIFVILPEYV